MKRILVVSILIMALLIFSSALTSSDIATRCHCDLIKQFCDFNCCCDTDCSTSISSSCFNQKSKKYCPKTQFFYKIKGSQSQTLNCYYYNTSSTLIDQQTLSNTQRTQYVNKFDDLQAVSSTANSGSKGYKLSSILTIGGKSEFSFVSSTGTCLTTAGVSKFSFKFGQNIKISCTTSSTTVPLIFSQILGKTIPKYLNVQSNNIQLPSISGSLISLKINFIISTYGSQNTKYIQKIIYSSTTGTSTTKTLYFNFIDSKNIEKEQTSASFFPQIPKDMFYPIHMMS